MYCPAESFRQAVKKYQRVLLRKSGCRLPCRTLMLIFFHEWLTTELCCLPDALTVQEVADTTGYNKHSVEHWIRDGHLKCVDVQGGVKIVPKAWLMEFYCRYGFVIVQKSKQHEMMVRKFVAKVY